MSPQVGRTVRMLAHRCTVCVFKKIKACLLAFATWPLAAASLSDRIEFRAKDVRKHLRKVPMSYTMPELSAHGRMGEF